MHINLWDEEGFPPRRKAGKKRKRDACSLYAFFVSLSLLRLCRKPLQPPTD